MRLKALLVASTMVMITLPSSVVCVMFRLEFRTRNRTIVVGLGETYY